MVNLSPIARLEELGKEPHFTSAKSALNEILDLYQNFLEIKDDKEKLLARFSVPAELETLNQNAERFGMKMHEALNLIGKDTRFARLLMI